MWRMAMGTRQSEQASLWVATVELPKSPGQLPPNVTFGNFPNGLM
jgi:hypothetical protein